MIHKSGSSHVGSCFSIVEILTVLYFAVMKTCPQNPRKLKRDVFILSKGHAAAALYATLAHRGFFNLKKLELYAQNNSPLAGHVIKGCLPGVEATAGSLGHGLSLAAGMALAGKLDKQFKRKYYCLLGDGECNEGSVWEAVMFSAHYKLNNLIAIVDLNGQQGMGKTANIIKQNKMAERWKSFGWDVRETDGHSLAELLKTFAYFNKKKNDKPSVLIAHTIKGKGVSWMENSIHWHYKTPSVEQLKNALAEINSK